MNWYLLKVFSDISSGIIEDIFPLNTSSNYIIKNRSTFNLRSVNSVDNGSETLSHLAPEI